MTKHKALVSIAQTILRYRYDADAMVRAGNSPSFRQFDSALAIASNLVNSTESDLQSAREELISRYVENEPSHIPHGWPRLG